MTPEQVADLLVASLEQYARKKLPDFIQSSSIAALAHLLADGLKDVWVAIIEDITVDRIMSDDVEIVDKRET